MNPYQFETQCSICGGSGVSTGRDMASEWTGGTLAHNNPDICRRILAVKRKKELAAQEEKAAQDRAQFDADDEYMFEQMEENNDSA